jgi:hypothetical protein
LTDATSPPTERGELGRTHERRPYDPPPAGAANETLVQLTSTGELQVIAAPGVANDIYIARQGAELFVRDFAGVLVCRDPRKVADWAAG